MKKINCLFIAMIVNGLVMAEVTHIATLNQLPGSAVPGARYFVESIGCEYRLFSPSSRWVVDSCKDYPDWGVSSERVYFANPAFKSHPVPSTASFVQLDVNLPELDPRKVYMYALNYGGAKGQQVVLKSDPRSGSESNAPELINGRFQKCGITTSLSQRVCLPYIGMFWADKGIPDTSGPIRKTGDVTVFLTPALLTESIVMSDGSDSGYAKLNSFTTPATVSVQIESKLRVKAGAGECTAYANIGYYKPLVTAYSSAGALAATAMNSLELSIQARENLTRSYSWVFSSSRPTGNFSGVYLNDCAPGVVEFRQDTLSGFREKL